jgi:uncharacterized membrane protein YqiK
MRLIIVIIIVVVVVIVVTHRYITCKKEEHLLFKTLSFLNSHSDQIMAIAPTQIINLNLGSTPLSQLSKIFATL